MNPEFDNLGVRYGRVSTARQGDSLAQQNEKSDAYEAARDITIVAEFADENVSGAVPIHERPEGRTMFSLLARGWSPEGQAALIHPIRHLIVTKVDRCGRNSENLLAMWRWCKEHNVTLHLVDQGGDAFSSAGHVGKLVFGMLALAAEFEREMIVQRIQDAVDDRFAKLEIVGKTVPPYGWEAVSTERFTGKGKRIFQLVANEYQQRWIKRMKQWQAAGKSHYKIAQELNAAGVPTPTPAGQPLKEGGHVVGQTTGTWRSRTVEHVLTNKYSQLIPID